VADISTGGSVDDRLTSRREDTKPRSTELKDDDGDLVAVDLDGTATPG